MKLIQQTTYKDCGLACVAMLINHYFHFDIDLEQIKYQLGLDDNQLSFADVLDIGKHFELFGEAFMVDHDLSELHSKPPFLAQVINPQGIMHFVLVERITPIHIYVADPSLPTKQKYSHHTFLATFQGYVMLFKPNVHGFKARFAFHTTDLKKICNLENLVYIWCVLVLSVLMVLETSMIRIYSASQSQAQQSWVFYALFLLVFIFNVACKKCSEMLLNRAYMRKVRNDCKLLLSFSTQYQLQNLYNFYVQIIWVHNFEQYQLLNLISSFITNVIAFIYMAIIAPQILLMLILLSCLLCLIIYIKARLFKQRPTLTDHRWLTFANNLVKLKNLGSERQVHHKLMNLNYHSKRNINFELFLDFVLKVGTLCVYLLAWPMLKNAAIDFSAFFMLLILKGFNRSFLINYHHVLVHWQQYLSFKNKLNTLLTPHHNKTMITEIKQISIIDLQTNYQTNFSRAVHRLNQQIPLKNLNKTMKQHQYQIKINQTDLELINDLCLREHVIYLNGENIQFATLYQNIITLAPTSSINIFETPTLKKFVNKYNLSLAKLIEPNNYLNFDKECIVLFSIFYTQAQVILLDYEFKSIEKNDLTTIFNLFQELFCDKWLFLP